MLKLRTLPAYPIRRADLEYPTENVSLAYLAAINKMTMNYDRGVGGVIITVDALTDRAIKALTLSGSAIAVIGRFVNGNNFYYLQVHTPNTTQDFGIAKISGGSNINLTFESVDLTAQAYIVTLSISGSTLKGYRDDVLRVTATDTTFTSGGWGVRYAWGSDPMKVDGVVTTLLPPQSPATQAIAILDVEVEGSDSPDDPYRPRLSQNLIDIPDTAPDFLKREAKRYAMLRARGFRDEEIRELLGYTPQTKIDIDSVTWGAFEFRADSPTNIIVVTGDNPYNSGAVERQRARAKRSFRPPRDYSEAVELYNQLKQEHPDWLAGKDNFVYQVLGLEVYEPLAVIDFYYGELVEHRKHYNQIKETPDWELRRTLALWEARLEQAKPHLPLEAYDSHRAKLREALKVGW